MGGVFTEIKLHRAKLRWPAAVCLAALLVAFICKLDSSRQQTNQTNLALRWSRQIATQAETLSLSASEHGEKDPLAWAARILSQGTDSRIIFAQKYRPEGNSAEVTNQSVENYEFDPDSGILDYSKILFPEDSAGIRIKLFVARTGVFGAKTILTQDLTIAALFGVFLSLFLFISKRPEEPIELPPPFVEPPSTDWVAGFKHALVELGKDIREMTRSAQKLSAGAVRAREEIGVMKSKLNGAIVPPLDPNEMTNLAREAQALFTTVNPETKIFLRKLLQISLRKASEADSLKKCLEDISAHSESAFSALNEVTDHAHQMSERITKTTSDVRTVKQSGPKEY